MPDVTHLILANTERDAQRIAGGQQLLRWNRVTGTHGLLGHVNVVLHIERGYIETPAYEHLSLELPGCSIAWGTSTRFPILRAIQMMLARGAIREVRQHA